jgi:thiamine pyrophosphate-dependent enzyme
MAERTGGQLLVDALAHQGVRTIFGIPGVQLDHAADALYQAADRDPGSLAGVLHDAMAGSEPVLVEVPVGEFPSPWHLIHEGIPRPAPIAPGAHLPTERRHA